MPALTIDLSEDLRRFVEERVTKGGYSSASHYLASLLAEDQKQFTAAEMTSKILQGYNTSGAHQLTEKDWKKIRSDVHRQLGPKKKL